MHWRVIRVCSFSFVGVGRNLRRSVGVKSGRVLTKISYRLATLAMASVFAVACWISSRVPMNRPRPPMVEVLPPGTVSMDACLAWEQMAVSTKLSVLAWFATLLVLPVAGLLNRRLPRWVAVFGLVACTAMMWTTASGWRWQHCYSAAARILWVAWIGSVAVLCVHQLLHRPPR